MKKPLVTEVERTETKRVEKAINNAKTILFLIFLPAFAVLPFIISYYQELDSMQMGIMFVAIGVVYIFFNALVNNHYKGMLTLARKNDEIRHEEKVRAIERDRFDRDKEIERLKRELEVLKQGKSEER